MSLHFFFAHFRIPDLPTDYSYTTHVAPAGSRPVIPPHHGHVPTHPLLSSAGECPAPGEHNAAPLAASPEACHFGVEPCSKGLGGGLSLAGFFFSFLCGRCCCPGLAVTDGTACA